MPVLSIKEEDFTNYTPVMQQYLKARNGLSGRAVLFFRMGDFYEAFFEDAEEIARELEITLTGRPETNHPQGRIPMAGVPARAVKPYIGRLLERNYKVHIAEQMADPKTCKGLVPREIVKVYTPGTINELEYLESYQNNFLLAVVADSKKENFGLAYTDISTGEFYVTELKANLLEQEISRVNASEIIVPSIKQKRVQGQIVAEEMVEINLDHLSSSITPYSKDNFDIDLARQNLSSVFEINSVDKLIKDSLGTGSQGLGLMAAGAIIEYLKETQAIQFAENISKNFDVIKTYQVSEYLVMDNATRKNLELIKTLSGDSQGSFFASIDRTSSKLGRRKLQNWLLQPLLNISEINARQEAVQELLENVGLSAELRRLLRESYDIDRLSNRLASGLIAPRELISLKDSLLIVVQISVLMQDIRSPLLTSLKFIPDSVMSFIREVEAAIKVDPNINITEGGIINLGFNQELDDYISLVEDSETWLRNYEESEKSRTGIKLKVSFNKVHGYFIETSRLNQNKLPEDYLVKQTMVNSLRAVTQDLQEFEEKINNAESRRNGLEYKIYSDLRLQLSDHAALIKQLAHHVAQLDALLSLATLAREQNYSKPIVDDSFDLEINSGRHSVVEQKLKLGEFVANDLELNKKIMILTGPNMSGKSTYMRQNALIIILAQMGGFVPASYARIGLVDRIFTRIGASDDLASGQSTFMVEMIETAAILNGMTQRSFIVLDEIGRGTSTYDGVAIAWSIVEYLAKSELKSQTNNSLELAQEPVSPRTIFATHYHELANLEHLYPCVNNYQVLVAESNNKIEFLHKVVAGSANKSYGIEVARLAGLPNSVLERARAINNQLVANRTKKLGLNKNPKLATLGKLSEKNQLEIENLPLFESIN
jgi:DNA mismatch repair protein MutS